MRILNSVCSLSVPLSRFPQPKNIGSSVQPDQGIENTRAPKQMVETDFMRDDIRAFPSDQPQKEAKQQPRGSDDVK
jgi:hypothetical protein